MKKFKALGLVAAVFILALIPFLPVSEALSREAIASICILGSVLVLLLTEALPIAITCLLAPSLLIIFKAVEAPPEAFSGFTNPIVFFIIASFGISLSISSTNISKRLLVKLAKVFGKSVDFILLAIMICTAVLSSIISNVAATVIFLTVAIDFLSIYDNEKDKRQTGKAFMISLPIASMIGGMITPAGSSLNLLMLSFLEKLTGQTVSFVQWMLCAIPIVLVAVPLAWFIIVKINKPVPVSKAKLDEYVESINIKEKFSSKEWFVSIIVFIMIFCWVLSSWFPIFNITVVATVGLSLMFLPGIEVLKWEDLVKEISWSAILLVGSVISIGNALIKTGASTWIVGSILPDTLNLPEIAIAFIVAIIVFFMLTFIPVAPALISVMSAPLVALAAVANVSPVLLMMTLALTVCNCFLLPFDTVPIITYMTGYYKKIDLAKTAIWIQLGIAALVALWLPIALRIVNL